MITPTGPTMRYTSGTVISSSIRVIPKMATIFGHIFFASFSTYFKSHTARIIGTIVEIYEKFRMDNPKILTLPSAIAFMTHHLAVAYLIKVKL